MKKVPVLFFAMTAMIISSCGINDLEDRLDKLENIVGSNEPLRVEFKTTDNQNREITLKQEYIYQAAGYNSYIQINDENEVDVYVENFKDVDWNEGAWVSFIYNTETKEIIQQASGIYFINKYGNWTQPRFNGDNTGQTVNIKLNSINLEKGEVDFELTATSASESPNNYYSGKAMEATIRYKGTLELYDRSDVNNNTRIHR